MKRAFILIALCVMTQISHAQSSRDFIRQNIRKHNECKSVAITQHNGDAMLYGQNGWAAEGCPKNFTDALHKLNEAQEDIQDIHLTEEGRWLILYNSNGMYWDNIYYDLKQKMVEYNDDGEKITTITFNDDYDWIIITTKHISASSEQLLTWLGDGCDKYGLLWTACLTDDAVVAVYEEGFQFIGNIPETLKEALKECESDVYNIKIAGSAWFFRCTDGYWRYHM